MPKSFRVIPNQVRRSLEAIPDRYVVAGCTLQVSASDIRSGSLSSVGIALSETGLTFEPEVVPPASSGRFSKRNRQGQEIVRRDLPMETLYNIIDTPNWGDWGNGSHDTYLPYHRYPRDFVAPALATVRVNCSDCLPDRELYALTFRVSEILDRESVNFEQRLLASVSLLQENVGSCGVYPATVSPDQYLETLHVSWELLPPGTLEEAVQRLFRDRPATPQERQIVEERYPFLMSLNPQRLVSGTSGLTRYFGAQLATNLMVFENVRYGNAVYVMFEDWENLSQRSRVELLSGRYGDSFERVIHRANWQQRVRSIVRQRRE
jgi:hypothetical protein